MSFNPGGGGKIATASDVALSTPKNNQTLTYNGTLALWQNNDPSRFATFNQSGALAVATGTNRFPFPVSVTILGVSAAVGTAPVGASIIVDVKKNGTTVYTTTANRPAVAAGANTASETLPDVVSLAAGDYLTVDIVQVGSTTAGSDLTVQVRYR
jgi:hypothetical protein